MPIEAPQKTVGREIEVRWNIDGKEGISRFPGFVGWEYWLTEGEGTCDHERARRFGFDKAFPCGDKIKVLDAKEVN